VPVASRKLLKILLASALLLRSLVPVGFMLDPAQAGEGQFAVIICSAGGTYTITLDADGDPVPPTNDVTDHSTCPFSTAATLATLSEPPSLAVEFDLATLQTSPLGGTGIEEPGHELPGPARGPPTLQS
jgi:Protein of unknown function (DUF2946)